MEDVKLRNVSAKSAEDALSCVLHFNKEYPNRIGIRHGVAYSKPDSQTFYVYRTKTNIVAVGQ